MVFFLVWSSPRATEGELTPSSIDEMRFAFRHEAADAEPLRTTTCEQLHRVVTDSHLMPLDPVQSVQP